MATAEKLKTEGKIRFLCPLCHFCLETVQACCTPLDCPGCGRQIFVPASRFEPGCVIDDFVIGEKLGSGSIGTVYKALQYSLEREVALKILSPELTDIKTAGAFLREARAAAKIIHVNLVQAYAVGEENCVFFMAMNYINGESLKTRIQREGRIAVDEALHIVQQVAEALHYAWQEAKMIHRDVKPDNIMITAEGIVKLTDLGLAIKHTEWTEDMDISGTPSYMSPEQFAGEQLDPRSDIYSLGITLYQMLAGVLPFDAETIKSVADQHYLETAVPLQQLSLDIPARVSCLVRKMMEKLPEDRFRDTEALIKEICLIRQTTSKNKHMVPAMHTVSISKLKYQPRPEPPPEQTPAGVNINSSTGKFKTRRDYLFWGMAAVFPIPFIILFASVWFHPANKEPNETAFLEDRLELLEKKLAVPDMPPAALAVEASRLLAIFPEQHTPKQEELFVKLKNHIAGFDSVKKAVEMEEKTDYVKSLEGQLKELVAAKTGHDNQLTEEIKQLESKNKTLASTLADLTGRLKVQDDKIKQQQANFTAELARQRAAYEKYWKTDLLNDLYAQLKEEDYARAEARLVYKRSLLGKEYNVWFNSYLEWVKHLHLLTGYFDTGKSNLIGRNIDGRRITMINDGNIYFELKDGGIKSCKWYEFSPQGIYELLQIAKPALAGNRQVFDGDIACLKENIFSPAAIKGRPCLKELCMAAIDSQIESIFSIAVYDKNQAAVAADSLLNMLKNTEFVPMVKARLGTLCNQK